MTFQLWKPVGGHQYKLIWRKAVYPDINSGGGFRHKVYFTTLFWTLPLPKTLLSCYQCRPRNTSMNDPTQIMTLLRLFFSFIPYQSFWNPCEPPKACSVIRIFCIIHSSSNPAATKRAERNASEYHINHCHMDGGGSKTHPEATLLTAHSVKN